MDTEVIEKLKKSLDPKRIKTREQAGRTFSYLESHDVIRTANEVFGYGGWGNHVIDLTCLGEEPATKEIKDDRGNITKTLHGFKVGYRATVRVEIGEGNDVQAFCDVGYGDAVDYSGSKITPHELAAKEAVSDAVKRCLRNFGDQFGLGLYDKDAPTNKTPKQSQDEKEILAGLQGMSLYPEDPGDFVISFGKHKGSKLSNIPKPYISWLASKFEAKDEYGTAVVENAKKFLGTGTSEPQWTNGEDLPF